MVKRTQYKAKHKKRKGDEQSNVDQKQKEVRKLKCGLQEITNMMEKLDDHVNTHRSKTAHLAVNSDGKRFQT